MTTNIDNLSFLSIISLLTTNSINLIKLNVQNNFLFNSNCEYYSSFFLIKNEFFINYLNFFLSNYYTLLIESNLGFFLIKVSKPITVNYVFYLYVLLEKIFKLNLFMFIIYTIYFLTNFENYIKQLKTANYLAKLFILNVTEKEVGPVDDYFFFAVLFILTISLFIFTSITLLLIHSKIFVWALGSLLLLAFLVLTIPVSLFIDFGIVFCVAIKGSASGNNLVKELLFDIISTTTVFIRFVIQNIRFFFIFSGIFELLEWTITNNNIFILNDVNTVNNFYTLTQFNVFFVNFILFIVFYFYYILHLLFLLLVQVTIYVGISIWLFFFLYSTKFLTKYEKFFIFKKINN